MRDARLDSEILKLKIGSWMSELALALVVRGVLHDLPAPRQPLPPRPRQAESLWRHLDGLHRVERTEGAFASTARMVKRDLWRKKADQNPDLAACGEVPPGFEAISGIVVAPERPPLNAFFRPPQPGRSTVIVVHGLYDSKFNRYVSVASSSLREQGFGVLVPDMRWHGTLLSNRWLPTLGIEEALDLLAWAEWLRAGDPAHPIGLLGFSLGALNVIHALGLDRADAVFDAGGIAISPPASLRSTARELDRVPSFRELGLSFFLRRSFQSFLRTRMDEFGISYEPDRMFGSLFDWLLTSLAPRLGVDSQQLYETIDPLAALSRIKSPLLILASRNDPIFPAGTSRELGAAAAPNPLVHVVETPGGGHIGHLGAYPQWTAEVFEHFFSLAPGLAHQAAGSAGG